MDREVGMVERIGAAYGVDPRSGGGGSLCCTDVFHVALGRIFADIADGDFQGMWRK